MVRLLLASHTVEFVGKAGLEAEPFHHVPDLQSIFEVVTLQPLAQDARMQILRQGFRSKGSSEHDDVLLPLAEKNGNPLHLHLAAGVLSSGQAGVEVG